jgi:hypothetical protein
MSWVMNPIEGDPRPRAVRQTISHARPHLGIEEVLAVPSAFTQPLDAVIEARRSRRRYEALVPRDLSTLLWYSAGARLARAGTSYRPAPSAGGIHPIHVLVASLSPHVGLAKYNPQRHTLLWLDTDEASVRHVYREADAFMPTENARLLAWTSREERLSETFGRVPWVSFPCPSRRKSVTVNE